MRFIIPIRFLGLVSCEADRDSEISHSLGMKVENHPPFMWKIRDINRFF